MKYFSRDIESKIKKYSEFFKVVAVTGARQVGKSTSIAHIFPDYEIITFDPVQDLFGARKDPDMFLKNFKAPLILDEIQYAPELIPAIKRFVDKSDSPGQYIITGSQNFSVLRTVSESLAGRVGIINMFGMTGSELNEISSSDGWLKGLLNNGIITNNIKCFPEDVTSLSSFLWRGTMPGLINVSDDFVSPYFESYVTTYVERDVRLMEDIKNLSDFGRFLRICAALTAQEINHSQLGREIGVTPQTASRWLNVLKHSFQWIELDPYFGNTIKRISGKKKGYLTDTGLICFLQRVPNKESLLGSPLFGPIFETYAVNNIIKTLSQLSLKPSLYHWRTSGGAEVDLVMEFDGRLFPVEVKSKTNLRGNDTRGLRAFFETYPDITELGIVIYGGNKVYEVKENIWAIPWNAV